MAKAMQTTEHEEHTVHNGEEKRKRWKGKLNHASMKAMAGTGGRISEHLKDVEKKRTDTYPNLRYLATDLWAYSITSWLTKWITVGWGLRPIRLEYKNITPFFLNDKQSEKVNTRLFSCCGDKKYSLSHENQKVRPHHRYVLKSHTGFLQKGPVRCLLEPLQELPQAPEGTGSENPNLCKSERVQACIILYFFGIDSILPLAHLGSYLPQTPCNSKALLR